MQWGVLAFLLLYLVPVQSQVRPDFEKATIKLNKHLLIVELADTQEKRAYGLMHRLQPLKANEGMLFIFEVEHRANFWMKNTFLDLDIGFFNAKKVFVDKTSLDGLKSLMQTEIPEYQTTQNIKYALELPKGWFAKNKIKLGTRFKFVASKKTKDLR